MKFRTEILLAGKTATGIQVPDEIVEKLGSGKRPAVRVTINGYTYRSTVAVMGREALRKTFDGLSYTRRKEHVRSIEEAKTPETRQRRVDKAVSELGR